MYPANHIFFATKPNALDAVLLDRATRIVRCWFRSRARRAGVVGSGPFGVHGRFLLAVNSMAGGPQRSTSPGTNRHEPSHCI